HVHEFERRLLRPHAGSEEQPVAERPEWVRPPEVKRRMIEVEQPTSLNCRRSCKIEASGICMQPVFMQAAKGVHVRGHGRGFVCRGTLPAQLQGQVRESART